MTALMEQPLLIIALGLITVILLGSGLLKTGHRGLIYALLAAVVVFGALLTAERLVKTDREQIRQMLANVAEDVQRNDLAAVLEHIHRRAPAIRARAQSEMPRYRFSTARITRIRQIDVDDRHTPRRATAEFSVRVDGQFKGGYGGEFRVPRFVIVQLERDDGRWKVLDYQHDSIDKALKTRNND